MSVMRFAVAWMFLMLGCSAAAVAGPVTFNGGPENQIDVHDYFYSVTGGKFPTGTDPNGSRISGGTFAYVSDDPIWGANYTAGLWRRDGWFAENAGLALTLQSGLATVYDNNGIEDGTYGDYYDAQAQGTADKDTPGLYRGYNMRDNYDWAYATYFKLEQDTTFDKVITYFDWTGYSGGFDPDNLLFHYYTNIWTAAAGQDCTQDNVGCLPTNNGMFRGDAFSTDLVGGSFSWSLTGVNRVFSDGSTDPIGRLVFTLDQPFILAAGEYFINNGAGLSYTAVPEPASMLLFGLGLVGAGAAARRRRQRS